MEYSRRQQGVAPGGPRRRGRGGGQTLRRGGCRASQQENNAVPLPKNFSHLSYKSIFICLVFSFDRIFRELSDSALLSAFIHESHSILIQVEQNDV